MSEVARLSETPAGIRVVTETVPDMRSVALGFWVRTGSRDETESEAGVSHFLEHLLFKGTPELSAVEISEFLDGIGAQFNAFTSKEATHLYARFLDRHLERAFGVLGEMFLRPTLAEIDSERQVVIEEIAMYGDDPDSIAHDLIAEAVFGDTPLGRPIIGRAEVIGSIPKEQIREYHDARYTGPAIVISAAGNVDHDELLGLAAELTPGVGESTAPVGAQPAPAGAARAFEKETEQYHLVVGNPGIDRSDERRFCLAVLDSILGGSASSRLFTRIREERGLAYSVGTYAEQYSDSGLFAIHAGTRGENLGEVCEILAEEMGRIATEPPGVDEVERAKELVKGRLVLAEESNAARMSRIGRAALHDLPILTLDEMLDRIDAVGGQEVLDLAGEILGRSSPSSACVGPDTELIENATAVLEGVAAA
ncbi:MAG: M16 family metallopeptidase [Solirubrobacterales bacterium]